MKTVTLPTLHNGRAILPERGGQVAAFWASRDHRFLALRCGRRWGKTAFDSTIAADGAAKGQHIGFFAPDYKRLTEAYNDISAILRPIRLTSSRTEGVYRTITGGNVDFWTLEDQDAGRSRKYHKVIIDEGAFTKPTMLLQWEKAIKPTLLDYGGRAIVSSNTNGIDEENFLYQICHEPRYGFFDHHAPTFENPLLPQEELDKLQAENHPLVFQQEYLADFISWKGRAFFSSGSLLVDDKPVEAPNRCDAVFAIIDTAVKTGTENDGTAVLYCAKSRITGYPLVILDWSIEQIEGASLEVWLPTVFQNLEALAKKTGARFGSVGALIEDKSSGSILLQQAKKHRDWKAEAIDSKLTAFGKDERAIKVSGYVYRGEVKIAREAYDKVTTYKKTTRNHFLTQVTSFRVGDKDAAKRADDLLDCFTYAIAVALGDSSGL